MRTHAQLWAHVRGGNMRPVPDQDMPRFFVYSGKLDQAWLRQCPGFDALESGTATEKLGEVRLYDALQHHRLRTHNASEASFILRAAVGVHVVGLGPMPRHVPPTEDGSSLQAAGRITALAAAAA